MCPKKNWDIYFSSDSESDSQERKFMGYVEEPPISGDWVDDEHKKDFFDWFNTNLITITIIII